jgi:hypothetical protein
MRDHQGRIFFLAPYGCATLAWPILEDKTILPEANIPHPDEVAILVNARDLGITEIKWAPPGTKITA